MFSAVLEINLVNSCVNALLDTGASCSLMDIDTLERLGLDQWFPTTVPRHSSVPRNDYWRAAKRSHF